MYQVRKNYQYILHILAEKYLWFLIIFFLYPCIVLANNVYPEFVQDFKKIGACPQESYSDSGIYQVDDAEISALLEKLKNKNRNDPDYEVLLREVGQKSEENNKRVQVFNLCRRVFLKADGFFNNTDSVGRAERFYELIVHVENANNSSMLKGRFNTILKRMKEELVKQYGKPQPYNWEGDSLGPKGAVLSYQLFADGILFEKAFRHTVNGLERKEVKHRLINEPYTGNEKYIKLIIPRSAINQALQICSAYSDTPFHKAGTHDPEWSGLEFGGIDGENKYYLETSELASSLGDDHIKVVVNAYELLSERYGLRKKAPDASSDLCAPPEEPATFAVQTTDSPSTNIAAIEVQKEKSNSTASAPINVNDNALNMFVTIENLILRSDSTKSEATKLFYRNESGQAKPAQLKMCTEIKSYRRFPKDNKGYVWSHISLEEALQHIPTSDNKLYYENGQIYEDVIVYVAYRKDRFFLKTIQHKPKFEKCP